MYRMMHLSNFVITESMYYTIVYVHILIFIFLIIHYNIKKQNVFQLGRVRSMVNLLPPHRLY